MLSTHNDKTVLLPVLIRTALETPAAAIAAAGARNCLTQSRRRSSPASRSGPIGVMVYTLGRVSEST